jgi:hypothetical protein
MIVPLSSGRREEVAIYFHKGLTGQTIQGVSQNVGVLIQIVWW